MWVEFGIGKLESVSKGLGDLHQTYPKARAIYEE